MSYDKQNARRLSSGRRPGSSPHSRTDLSESSSSQIFQSIIRHRYNRTPYTFRQPVHYLGVTDRPAGMCMAGFIGSVSEATQLLL